MVMHLYMLIYNSQYPSNMHANSVPPSKVLPTIAKIECFFKQQLHSHLPRILLILELCMSGNACRIRRLSSLAHTMKAFIGRLMWPEVGVRDSPKLPTTEIAICPVGNNKIKNKTISLDTHNLILFDYTLCSQIQLHRQVASVFAACQISIFYCIRNSHTFTCIHKAIIYLIRKAHKTM